MFVKKSTRILGKINFDGHIKKIVQDERKAQDILDWLRRCRKGDAKYEPCKNYPELVAFIYKSSDNQVRGILTKKKNSYFVELFIDKHKYYDEKRKYLGI